MVPRFSNVALVSVTVLLASGIWASVLHMPLLSALWTTSYGQVILVKAALLAAMVLASVNLVRTKPRLCRGRHPPGARPLCCRLVAGEVLVAGRFSPRHCSRASPPPSKTSRRKGRRPQRSVPGKVARRAPGRVYAETARRSEQSGRTEHLRTADHRNGRPVTGADVTVTFAMLDMTMGTQEYQMTETAPGRTHARHPALVMVGHWGLSFTVTPKGGEPFTVLVVDHAAG